MIKSPEEDARQSEGHRLNQGGPNSKSNPFWDFWGPVFFTLILYSAIRHYLVEARYIPSGSMLPGLQIQDRLLIEKITFRSRSPRRGEIVVFNSPYGFDKALENYKRRSNIHCALWNFPLVALIPGLGDSSCDAYIKRVVGVAGDHVFVNSKGEVILNGQSIDEVYVSNPCIVNRMVQNQCLTMNMKVPKGHVIVLGDNRRNSWDSRFWPGGGLLPEREIIGRAIWRFWPINRIGLLTLPGHRK